MLRLVLLLCELGLGLVWMGMVVCLLFMVFGFCAWAY